MDFATSYAEFDCGDTVKNAGMAASKIKADLKDFPVSTLLFFASPDAYDPETLAAEMRRSFPGAKTFGCSSAGEMANDRILWQSVVAMAFSPRVFERIEIAGASNIEADPKKAVDRLFAELEQRLGSNPRSLDFRKHAGLLLIDGLSNAGAAVTERAGELTDVILIGGYAGDERHFKKTLVYNDGKALENGLVMAIMKPRKRFKLIKTQSTVTTDISLVATRVDPKERIIHEFNGKPAALAYAEAMGMGAEGNADRFDADAGHSAAQAYANGASADPGARGEKSFSEGFINWPLAIMVDGEPFVRSAVTVTKGGGLKMFLPPIEGMRYRITRATDVAEETRRALDEARRELGGISAVVGINCLLREIQVMNDGRVGEYSSVFKDFPYVGMSSFGEVYVSPVNQTAVMLVFE